MARPEKTIDFQQFEQLCALQCTQAEICSVLKVTDKTLTKKLKDNYGMTYSEIHKMYSDHGKTSLRRYQWTSAKKGNPSLLIWLGKQHLDQSDKNDLNLGGSVEVKNRLLDGTITEAE